MGLKQVQKMMNEMTGDVDTLFGLIDQQASRYSKEMDDYVHYINNRINNDEKFTDKEVEEIILKVPVYLYFAVEGLEQLGIEMDLAKNRKVEKENKVYLDTDGTIEARKREAELMTAEETVLESVSTRSYKLLNARIQKAEAIYNGFKKVYDKRIKEIDAQMLDRKYKDLSGAGHIDNK